MGLPTDHERKASHNANFLRFIQRHDVGSNPTYPDWLVTVSFYTSLHYVDAKLASLIPPLHPRNHAERNNFVARNLPPDTARKYFYLKSKSEFARYFPDSERRISANTVSNCITLALKEFI